MTDIVERLRAARGPQGQYSRITQDDLDEAADEIERLLNLNEGLNYEYARLWDERKKAADEIERLRAMLRDRPRDDGTVVAVGGEPGASAGKSE